MPNILKLIQQWNRARWRNEPFDPEKFKALFDSQWSEQQKEKIQWYDEERDEVSNGDWILADEATVRAQLLERGFPTFAAEGIVKTRSPASSLLLVINAQPHFFSSPLMLHLSVPLLDFPRILIVEVSRSKKSVSPVFDREPGGFYKHLLVVVRLVLFHFLARC